MKFSNILVTSGYGANTRQPFIEVKAEQLVKPLQLSPEEARDLALNLLEAAEAAEQDAFIVEFHTQLAGGTHDIDPRMPERIGANILKEYRKWRDDHGQNK